MSTQSNVFPDEYIDHWAQVYAAECAAEYGAAGMSPHDNDAQIRVLDRLRFHIGRARGITARALCEEVNASGLPAINERDLRTIVTQLRQQGHHVCAHPSCGYFLAASSEELEETLKFLRDRAMTSLQQVSAMTQVSLPDLLGQLHLPT